MKKQKQYKICVYIVSSNYGKFLKKSIDSVLAQTFKNWQLYLINDGSTDNTLSIFNNYKKKYKKKITILNLKKKNWAAKII